MAPTTIPAPLLGKVAVITGGTRGIGEATAMAFVRRGISHLAITYHSSADKANEVLSDAKKINPQLVTAAFQADTMDVNCGKKVIATALKDLKVDHLDIVVSNAAIHDIGTYSRPVAETDKQLFDLVMGGCTWTPMQMALEAAKVMPPGGRIVLNSSTASRVGTKGGLLLYSMAKAALESTARNLAFEWGASKGITINSISIGATDTASMTYVKNHLPDIVKTIESGSSLNRIASAEEVANIIAFVASADASWINGNCVPANGGYLLALQG